MSPRAADPRSPRRDAQRNRALVVSTAREAFAEGGVETRLDEIARRAGVGIATLYRHFPTRESLVEAIFAERVGEFLAVAEGPLAATDAWDGLVGFLEGALELQSGDRVLREVFVRYPPGEGLLADAQRRMREVFERLLERAHEQGALRPDFAVPDLALLLWSFAPVIDATAETAPRVWRRHLHWLLDGMRAAAATPQREPPLDSRQLDEAMRRKREQRFSRRPGPRRRDEARR